LKIYKVQEPLPVLVINGKTYNGFKSVDEIEGLLPKNLVKLQQEKSNSQEETQ